jgi:hypothetical protein
MLANYNMNQVALHLIHSRRFQYCKENNWCPSKVLRSASNTSESYLWCHGCQAIDNRITLGSKIEQKELWRPPHWNTEEFCISKNDEKWWLTRTVQGCLGKGPVVSSRFSLFRNDFTVSWFSETRCSKRIFYIRVPILPDGGHDTSCCILRLTTGERKGSVWLIDLSEGQGSSSKRHERCLACFFLEKDSSLAECSTSQSGAGALCKNYFMLGTVQDF